MHMQSRFTAVVTLVVFQEKFWIQGGSTSQGLPYDFSSIMHFRHNAFLRNGYESTVLPRNRTIPKTFLGSSATATDLDFLHINLLYCGGTEVKSLHCCAFGGIDYRYFLRLTCMYRILALSIRML